MDTPSLGTQPTGATPPGGPAPTPPLGQEPLGDKPPAGPGPLGQPVTTNAPLQNKPKMPKAAMWGIIATVAVLLVGAGVWAYYYFTQGQKTADKTDQSIKTTLVVLSHWLEDSQINGIKDANGNVTSKGFQHYLDEYEALNPNIDFTLKQVHVSKYDQELKVMIDSGAAPDIYQIYSTWGASLVRDGALAEPPAALKEDIETNYISTAGATIEGKTYGIPTETNNFAMLYNKKLFKDAGIVDANGNAKAPVTWQDVVDDAKKLAKRDANGNITQYGIAFTRDTDWTSVDPYLSLLFTNEGEFLSSDLKKASFNNSAGVAALNAQMQLFTDKSTNLDGNFFDFKDGKVGIALTPPWTKSTFAAAFGDDFEDTVGVAPFPYMKKPSTLQYNWFTGVTKDSLHQEEAWKFLEWMTTETLADTGTTRMGDLLANTIGAIPARKQDFEAHKDVLGDFFTGVFVNQMKDSKAEPNVLQSSSIKAALMAEIQAAWEGKKTAQQALDEAATNVNKILEQYYK